MLTLYVLQILHRCIYKKFKLVFKSNDLATVEEHKSITLSLDRTFMHQRLVPRWNYQHSFQKWNTVSTCAGKRSQKCWSLGRAGLTPETLWRSQMHALARQISVAVGPKLGSFKLAIRTFVLSIHRRDRYSYYTTSIDTNVTLVPILVTSS